MCKRIIATACTFAVLALCLSACGNKKEFTVLAAASLENALTEIILEYEKAENVKIAASYGASGQLAMQIENGAPAEIFISAGEKQIKQVAAAGLCESTDYLLKNTLIIVTADTVLDITALENADTVAMGEPQTVPAGQYAKQALENAGLWEKISKKAVFLGNVREVLAAVESGNANAGFVYKTDVSAAQAPLETAEIPQELYSEILYPAALLKSGEKNKAAEKFYEYLFGETAQAIFEKYGFIAA